MHYLHNIGQWIYYEMVKWKDMKRISRGYFRRLYRHWREVAEEKHQTFSQTSQLLQT
jgi:hypothetical protein